MEQNVTVTLLVIVVLEAVVDQVGIIQLPLLVVVPEVVLGYLAKDLMALVATAAAELLI